MENEERQTLGTLKSIKQKIETLKQEGYTEEEISKRVGITSIYTYNQESSNPILNSIPMTKEEMLNSSNFMQPTEDDGIKKRMK